MSYYQEGHNGTVKKMSECSIFPNLSIPCHLYLVRYIRAGQIFPSGSKTVELGPDRIYLTPCRTYLTYQTYPSPNQVLVL
jgi:hypothetical protein